MRCLHMLVHTPRSRGGVLPQLVKRVVLTCALLGLVTFGALPELARPAAAADAPIVMAMYYAWYDQNSWNPAGISDQPVSPYRSAERSTIERQVQQAKAAGIDAFALNWWGPGNPTDENLKTLLDVAAKSDFRVTIDFDLNSPFIHNTGDLINDLRYITQYYSSQPWLRYSGKPVITFYGIRKYDVGTWRAIRAQADPSNQAIWIGEGDIFSYLSVFDGIHPYSISWSPDVPSQLASYASRARAYPGKIWVPTVMPGYDDTRLGRGAAGYARNRQGGAFYRQTWEGALATQPAIVSITSWNEWAEGSQIEPSQSYGDTYLQITRQFADRFHSTVSDVPAPAPGTVTGGHFFTEAGQGRGGYLINNDAGMSFHASFQALGDVSALGYPCSRRYQLADKFTYQATQGALLQWRPEYGRAILANTFEMLGAAGKDQWLDEAKGIPRPIADDGSNGDWRKAKDTRLSWLTDAGIKQKYLAAGSVERAIELYGLPMSKPERRGPFVVQRFQRIAFQNWVDSVPGMPAPGSVVRVLGGDLLKEAGLIPANAAEPMPQ